jgi:hypothetical protein
MRSRFAALLLLAGLCGCSSLYYKAQEKLGNAKRDILVKRVREGRQDQERAKQQIRTTLEAFQQLTGFQGGDLEKVYKKLDGEYQDAEKQARELREQIASIEQVAADMFREWEAEIASMKNAQFRAQSRTMLRDTRTRYAALIAKMKQSEAKMGPVLTVFRDQVLFLKHNLNARAIQSLKTTSVELDARVGALVKDIDASIQEADAFIAGMTPSP